MCSLIDIILSTEEDGSEMNVQTVAAKSPVLIYNIAIVYFHQKSYRKALDILETLCNNLHNKMGV